MSVRAARDHPLHALDPVLAVEFLIAGGCLPCEWRCAMPEGATWPTCPGCGRQTSPWARTEGDDLSTPEGRADSRERAAGYLAFRCNEFDAVDFVNVQLRLRPPDEILAAGGLSPDNPDFERKPQPGRFGYEQ